jgi:hypothetical protein
MIIGGCLDSGVRVVGSERAFLKKAQKYPTGVRLRSLFRGEMEGFENFYYSSFTAASIVRRG